MSDEKIIVTLTAQTGQKWDADKKTGAIGNYVPTPGRRSSWHLVFMPDGVEPDQKVRLLLREIREDSAGKMMYRGVPAAVEFTERWRDNGDGTASRVKFAIDWLLKEAEAGVIETRALGMREVPSGDRTDRKVVWGVDQTTTFVEKVEVKVFSQQTEAVQNGQLVWAQTGTREEAGLPERVPVMRVKVWAGDFDSHKFEVAYQDTWTLTADCYHADSDFVRENTVWGKLPAWLQAEVQAQYKEEVCIRCNKKSTVKNLSGRLVCDKCQPYETAEQLIEKSFPMERREMIAAEAKKLIAGQALPQEVGGMILKSTSDHITSSWSRDDFLRKWSGYGWYYFCEDGIYGTKLASAALQILQFLPLASGNGLVEMVAWLASGSKAQGADFYIRTQVQGEAGVSLPAVTADQLKDLKVAEFLRGSEADRIAALAGFKNLVEKLGQESSEARAVAEILQNEKQDYAAALAKVREAEEAPTRQTAEAEKVDLSQVNLSGLFGGAAKVNGK